MKDYMNTILIIVLICGIAALALYHRPEHDSVAELKTWFSGQLSAISADLTNDIERDKQGQYPHPGKASFKSRGSITYTLLDKNLSRFELSQFNELTADDVKSTAGYAQLKAAVDELGLKLKLEEVEVEGDGVDSWHELDEYVYDFPRFYTVTISGWSPESL
jgi:hypothetical protein